MGVGQESSTSTGGRIIFGEGRGGGGVFMGEDHLPKPDDETWGRGGG